MTRDVSWNEVDEAVRMTAEHFKDKVFKGVYGIPRGGLTMAVMLSHIMDIPLLSAPCENCLIVDDVADTGITLEVHRNKGYTIATMFYKRTSTVRPDFFFEETDEWIVFPWEITE